MSACEICRSASLARAGALDRLESAGAPAALARSELEKIASAAEPEGDALSTSDRGSLWTLCRHDEGFPEQLASFQRAADVPHVLYGAGQRTIVTELSEVPAIAIVGARRASAYGREVAYQLARDAAEIGITVVSGMALGIDGAAHRGALQGGGRTIAVLAGGADRPYPRSHRLLYEQICEAGAVVSEMPAGTEAMRWSFVARNRLIAGMSDLTIFVEGGEASGARHTVAFAEELDVQVGVVPGPVTSPMSAGPNALLGEPGVLPIRSLADVHDAFEFVLDVSPAPTSPLQLDGHQGAVLGEIRMGSRSPKDLAAALPELTPREITRLLGELELQGAVRRTSRGEYEISQDESLN